MKYRLKSEAHPELHADSPPGGLNHLHAFRKGFVETSQPVDKSRPFTAEKDVFRAIIDFFLDFW